MCVFRCAELHFLQSGTGIACLEKLIIFNSKPIKMNVPKIYNDLKTEEDFHDYLIGLRWPDGINCIHCGGLKVYIRKRSKRFKCSSCNKSFSVTARTIFHSSKIPLSKWFFALAQILAAKKGISSLQLSRTINVNKNTAWFMQMRIRFAMGSDEVVKSIISNLNELNVDETANNKEQECHFENHRETCEDLTIAENDGSGSRQNDLLVKKSKYCMRRIIKAEGSKSEDILINETDCPKSKSSKCSKANKIRLENIGFYIPPGYFSMFKRAIIGQYHKVSYVYLPRYCDEIEFKKKYGDIQAFDFVLQKACAFF